MLSASISQLTCSSGSVVELLYRSAASSIFFAISSLSFSETIGLVNDSDNITPSIGIPLSGSNPHILSSRSFMRSISDSANFPSRQIVSCKVRYANRSVSVRRKKPLAISSASLKELFAHVIFTCDSRSGSHSRWSKNMVFSIS